MLFQGLAARFPRLRQAIGIIHYSKCPEVTIKGFGLWLQQGYSAGEGNPNLGCPIPT